MRAGAPRGVAVVAVVVDSLQQTGPVWWIPLGIAVVGLLAAVAVLHRIGPRDLSSLGHLRRPAAAAGAITALPAWCAAGVGIALWSLLVAMVGFSWDVAWHA